ncbi:MAG: acyl-CoA/acyl-ACP dehydrogenase, partial [Pleurocapsa sp. SU_196_0]|nr:acyl-CoA/acyl-ACP dehydrogenase [Pleurocapsa sp. SU_196_0]
LLEPSFDDDDSDAPLASEMKIVANLKKAALAVAGSAALKFAQSISQQQEVMMRTADMIIQAFVAESALLRTQKIISSGKDASLETAMTQILVAQAAEKSFNAGREALSSFMDGDDLRMTLAAVRRFTKFDAVNVIALRRQIAAAVLEADGYPLK